MSLYLLQAAYTPEAWTALEKEPEDRIEAIRPFVERLGGKVICGYLSFGEYDILTIVDMPNNVSAAAFSMASSGGGFDPSPPDDATPDRRGSQAGHEVGGRSGVSPAVSAQAGS